MKTKKIAKILIAILVLILAAGTLIACDKNKGASTTYTVTFSGASVGLASQTVLSGGLAVEPKDPTRDGYDFIGWYNGEEKFDFSTEITEDITLTAKWKEIETAMFTVSFVGEGVDIKSQTVSDGSCAIEPKDPTRNGYTFEGWFTEDGKFDFSVPITKDIELEAKWDKKSEAKDSIKGSGTKDDPYVILTAQDLISFSERVNTPEVSGNETFYRSFFELGADIDMTGYSYTPAGIYAVINEREPEEYKVNGFMGNFDGCGHTISNLTLSKQMPRQKDYYVGLFGVTETATIQNFVLSDIEYDIVSGADISGIRVAYGGVVGMASLTNFADVTVSGKLNTHIYENNAAYIGGIVGEWNVSGGYIAYMENCYSDIQVVIGNDSEGAPCSLESAFNGGLVGYLYTYGSAASVINCVVDGKVYGGKYVGGAVGYIANDYVSLINCAVYATTTATATSISYAGGIIGFTTGDVTVLDCLATGRVVGKKSASSYPSYAGNIVGMYGEDDYEQYYTAGLAIVNTFYVRNISASGCTNSNNYVGGKSIDASVVTEAFLKINLRWTDDDMIFGADGKVIPNKKKGEATYKVNFGGKEPIVREYGSIIGEIDRLENKSGEVFFDFMFDEDTRYRYYVPVIKDIDLIPLYQDVSELAGVYEGTATWHETVNAGILAINDDGTLQWIWTGSSGGEYTFDGVHLIMTFYNDKGTVSGIYGKGTISFVIEEAASAEVSYTFGKTDLKVFGDYFSDNGDMITISGAEDISVHILGENNNNSASGKYSVGADGKTVAVTGVSIFSSMSMVINDDLTLTVTAIPKNPSTNGINGVMFSRRETAYEGKPFVGEYYLAYPSVNNESVTQDINAYDFDANGKVVRTNKFSSTVGAYYAFENGVIKAILNNIIYTLFYDEASGIIHGDYVTGYYGTHRYVVFTEKEFGLPKAMVIDRDVRSVLYVSGNKYFLIKNGVYCPDAAVTCEKGFADGDRVTIDGKAYRLTYESYYSNDGYALTSIGTEEGKYTFGDKKLSLDGVGNVVGDIVGTYFVYEGDLIVIMTDGFEFIGFDVSAAKEAGNVITKEEPDEFVGVWNQPKEVKDEDGSVKTIEEYYKLINDGYGHMTLLYYSVDYETYRYNWASGWVEFTKTAIGIHVEFNSIQKVDFAYYYDNNLIYTTNFPNYGKAFVKKGWSGSTVPPQLDGSILGSYTGEESDGTAVVFNLKYDLSGTYRGIPFVAVYDGNRKVAFEIASVQYIFQTDTKVLYYGNEAVELTRAGEVVEIIPAALVGTWSGVWTGYGVGADEKRTVKIESDGTVVYNEAATIICDFDAMTYAAEGTSANGNYHIKIVWDADKGTLSCELDNRISETEVYSYESKNMTKI